MNNLSLTCPNCNFSFEPADGIRDEIEKELRLKMKDWQKKKDEEFANKLSDEKKNMHLELQDSLKKAITLDFENKLNLLNLEAKQNELKLKEAREKERDFLIKQSELLNKEAELEITLQKKLLVERQKLIEESKNIEAQKIAQLQTEFLLKLSEKDKQLDDQRKLAEQMRKKDEQGSIQLQGEVQELLLEELLKTNFPYDKIEPVPKGVKGADCVQFVHTKTGTLAGKIIYESKRTKDFSIEWIEKLKVDMRSLNADIAIIVTQTMPKDMQRFGEKDGVYLCTFYEVSSVAALLRLSILKFFEQKKNQQNQGDKMVMLYEYLVGNEFSEQWKAIREGFLSMKMSIQKERDVMEKIWKSREKQLEKVLLNATHIRGSIEGIAGADSINLNLLDDADDALLLE